MRFLSLKISIPSEKIEKNIILKEGINTILTEENHLRGILPQVALFALFGKGINNMVPVDITGENRFSVTVESSTRGEKKEFLFSNGVPGNNRKSPDPFLSFDDFILYSYYTAYYPEGVSDPAINSDSLKKYLQRREAEKEDFSDIHRLREIIILREKEISELKKERELLELKKRKKDKLIKELNSSERELGKIKKKKDSVIEYRKGLHDLLELISDEAKIASKIVNIKKDIIEQREAAARIEELEKEIALRFPQFTSGMLELLPDLDRLQGEFNSVRDINVQMENFDSGRKKKISFVLKGITGSLTFAFISMMFILIKSIKLNTPAGILLGTISSLLVLISAAAGYYLFRLFREGYPRELISKKESAEQLLHELFKNENLSNKNFGTGELYEYLFQYFDDFLTFRELQNELTATGKKGGSHASIEEREGKLKELNRKKEGLALEIEKSLNSLDKDIHPVPGRENLNNLITEIDEMIAEAEEEEGRKKGISEKIKNEVLQYETGTRSEKSIDDAISGIDSGIERIKKEIRDINFMLNAYDDASDQWFEKKLDLLAVKTAEFYSRMAKETENEAKLAESVKKLVTGGGRGTFKPDEIPVLTLAMKLAVSRAAPPVETSPLIFIDPLMPDKTEIAAKLKKILLELSEKRQVVIIASKSETDLAGNLLII